MPTFNNGESAASVRTKINDAIDKVDGVSPITSADINGGTIDGTTIGGASAAAGTFTNLEANGTIKLDGNYPVGSNNVALGDGALDDAGLTGASNTAVGSGAMTANTSGACNVAFGTSALFSNTTGSFNTALGREALFCNTTGTLNTASGFNALRENTTGGSNTAIGTCALFCNTTGANNTASGTNALRFNTTGSFNTALGREALDSNVEGDQSTAIGHEALRNQNPVGNANMNNVALGFRAGCAITTGTNLTVIGASAAASANTATNEITLGNSSVSCLRIPGIGFAFDTADGLIAPKTITAGGTTGAQTIDKTAGSVNFAAAATSLVVTNSFVDANSVIVATVATDDTTMKSVAAVAGAGSFTLYANAAATAETRVNWLVVN
jgi:trimeric autotransporter adhesin